MILVLLAGLGNFLFEVDRLVVNQFVFAADRACYLHICPVLRPHRCAAEHVLDCRWREPGQHCEVDFFDARLPECSAKDVDLRVLVDKIVRSCEPQRSGIVPGSRMSITSFSHSSSPVAVMRQARRVSSLLASSSRSSFYPMRRSQARST